MPQIWIKDLPVDIPENVREKVKQVAKNSAVRKINIERMAAGNIEFGHWLSGHVSFGKRSEWNSTERGRRFTMAPGSYVIEKRGGMRLTDKSTLWLWILS